MRTIKYIHTRIQGWQNSFEQTDFCQLFGDADCEVKGGITFALQKIDEGCVAVSWAICSLNDVYNKKIGRDLANSRMINSNYILFSGYDESLNSNEILSSFLEKLGLGDLSYSAMFKALNKHLRGHNDKLYRGFEQTEA